MGCTGLSGEPVRFLLLQERHAGTILSSTAVETAWFLERNL